MWSMHDLEHRVSLVWVVDSYWRTIGTTHMGAPGRLMGGGVWLPGRLASRCMPGHASAGCKTLSSESQID